MNTKNTNYIRRMIQMRKRIFAVMAACFLMGSLILSASQPVEAGVFDFAMGKLRYTATVAEIVISLLTGSGAAVTNTSYLNQLNSAYGVESSIGNLTGTDGTLGAMYEAGLFEVDSSGAFIDHGLCNAIESVPEYQTLGISDYMATWANEGGMETVTTSAAENIGSSIGAAAALGTVSKVAGAFAFGYSLGELGKNFVKKYYKYMASGVNLDDEAAKFYSPGQRVASIYYNDGSYQQYAFHNVDVNSGLFALYTQNGEVYGNICNLGNSSIQYTSRVGSNPNNLTQRTYTLRAHDWTSVNVNVGANGKISGFVYCGTWNDLYNLITSSSGVPAELKPYSPDVVGKNGNQRPSDYSNPTTVSQWPDIGEQTPEGKGISCIPWDDYMDFVQDVNYNTTNNNTTIQQGDTYNNFVTNYYVTPEQIETGETVTNPDYDPTVPEQPSPNEKPEVTETEAQQNTDYMTTPGLKDVFPFCIPWDIKAMFALLGTNTREAPKITVPFTSELYGIDEDIQLDLSTFDAAAAILRTLELIGFAIGLAMATRSLIGAR